MADLEKLVEPGTHGDPESWLRWTSSKPRALVGIVALSKLRGPATQSRIVFPRQDLFKCRNSLQASLLAAL
jgi:hypothetical protein